MLATPSSCIRRWYDELSSRIRLYWLSLPLCWRIRVLCRSHTRTCVTTYETHKVTCITYYRTCMNLPWKRIGLTLCTIFIIAAYIYESYHPCLASPANKKAIYYMLNAFEILLTQYQVPHWIDFGTMIGAYRYGDIVPWDYDGDVSFDMNYSYLMHFGGNISNAARDQYHIQLNAAIMSYQGYSIDIFRWRRENQSGIPVYVKSHYRLSDAYEKYYCDFNASLVEPTVSHKIGPISVQGSNDLARLIRLRYPHSYHTVMPYKGVCYLPWVIPQWWGIHRRNT